MLKERQRFLQCWLPWTHSFGWPTLDKRSCRLMERCTVCGRYREAGATLRKNAGLSEHPEEFFPKIADKTAVE